MITAVQQNGYTSAAHQMRKKDIKLAQNSTSQINQANQKNDVSFKGAGEFTAKHFWMPLKRLSESMNNVTEYTNALIAAIGTGIIAPLVIECSPGKGDKEDKDKKFFQAIRQPLSAGLALAFQVPATYFINNSINELAYVKELKIFNDDVLGTLIPDKSYLSKQVKNSEIEELAKHFEESIDSQKSLKEQLEDKIRKDYLDEGIEPTTEDIAKQVKKEKKQFLKKQIVEKRYNEFVNKKFEELKNNEELIKSIKDNQLVTKDQILNIEDNFGKEISELESKAKLSWWDKTVKILGGSTQKTKELDSQIKNFKTEKAIELLKTNKPELFTDNAKRLKQFIDGHISNANEVFKNKKYWLSLVVNLFMVAASCYALNWAHPRLKALIDKIKGDNNQQSDKKVEVRA